MSPLLSAIVASAGLGALVGLIRQWRDQEEHAGEWEIGGVRTYAFWAMLGCLGAFAAEATSPVVLAVLVALVGAQQIFAKASAPPADRPGGTTFAASLLTVFTGGLMFWQQPAAAVLVATATAVLVGSKPLLHQWTKSFSRDDVRLTLKFAALSGAVLPLVPDRDLGPYGAFNPFSIWLTVVLISGLGFASYVAMRVFGARAGMLWAGFLGGLTSSTASTLAFSRRSRSEPRAAADCELALVVACTVMLPRVVVICAVISREFALRLLAPMALMAVPGVIFIAVRGGRAGDTKPRGHDAPQLANPLSLSTALVFGALYAGVTFLVKAASAHDWTGSLLPLSFVAGLTDVDAILLSLAHNFGASEKIAAVAMRAAVLAVVSNTLLKAGVALVVGATEIRRWIIIVLGLTAAIGAAWLLFPVEIQAGNSMAP